jgi:hypothetical protein
MMRLKTWQYLAGIGIGLMACFFSFFLLVFTTSDFLALASVGIGFFGILAALASAVTFYRARRRSWYMRALSQLPRVARNGMEVLNDLLIRMQGNSPPYEPEMRERGQYAPRYDMPPGRRYPLDERPERRTPASRGSARQRPATTILDNGLAAYTHALRAARAAGLGVDAAIVPIDLGFKVMTDTALSLVREEPITRDADSVQPYVRLYLEREAHGLLRFEMIDADGQRLFLHDTLVTLARGEHLVSPSSRLRVLDSFNFSGPWTLRVYADSVLLAEHVWSWGATRREKIQSAVTHDGEIHAEARARLEETDLFDRVSLEDLLADQDSAEQDAAARRRAAGGR